MDTGSANHDAACMAQALALATATRVRPWPNPPVGAVVVAGGAIVGRGAHRGPGTPHAEIVALEDAGPRARGATLYCTLEPCNHQGRTPPCAPAVAASGIRRLVTGMADPNPTVRGGGLEAIHRAGIAISNGVLAAQALELVWPFVATRAFSRPFVVLKTAASLDGRFAPSDQARGSGPVYLTGLEARRDVHRLRRWSDAVLVGERTMAIDRPRLDGRLAADLPDCPASDPERAYVDSDLSLDRDGCDGRATVYTTRHAVTSAKRRRLESAGTTIVVCEDAAGHVSPASLVEAFGARGGSVLLVEGGPTLALAFLQADLVDRWIAYTATVALGAGVGWPDPTPPGAPGWPQSFSLTRLDRVGADIKVVVDRLSFERTLRDVAGTEPAGWSCPRMEA